MFEMILNLTFGEKMVSSLFSPLFSFFVPLFFPLLFLSQIMCPLLRKKEATALSLPIPQLIAVLCTDKMIFIFYTDTVILQTKSFI